MICTLLNLIPGGKLSENPIRVYSLEEYELDSFRIDVDDREKINSYCRLPVWSRMLEKLFSLVKLEIVKSRKTGKIRHIYEGEILNSNFKSYR